MIALTGVGNIQEDRAVRPLKGRDRAKETATTETSDGVQISDTASTAAKVAQKSARDEIRQEMVAQAQKRIEEGTYKMQEVVECVAARIAGYMPA